MKEKLTFENFRRLLLLRLRHINKIKLMDFIINENLYTKRAKKKLKIKNIKNEIAENLKIENNKNQEKKDI